MTDHAITPHNTETTLADPDHRAAFLADLQPIFQHAWTATDDVEQQNTITETWNTLQVTIHEWGAVTEGLIEAVRNLKEQRDVTLHDLTDIQTELAAATEAYYAGGTPESEATYVVARRHYRPEISDLVHAIDVAAQDQHASAYAEFRANARSSLMADMAACITGDLPNVSYTDAKAAVAFLVRGGLSEEEQAAAADVFRQLANHIKRHQKG